MSEIEQSRNIQVGKTPPRTSFRLRCSRAMVNIWVIVLLGCLCGGINAFTKEEWQIKTDEILQELKSLNFEEMRTLHAETARVLPPGHSAIIGKTEVREYFIMMEDTWKMHPIDIPGGNIVTYTDEIAVVWYQFMCVDKEDLGCFAGKGVLMLKKVGREAKIEVDIWNRDS